MQNFESYTVGEVTKSEKEKKRVLVNKHYVRISLLKMSFAGVSLSVVSYQLLKVVSLLKEHLIYILLQC